MKLHPALVPALVLAGALALMGCKTQPEATPTTRPVGSTSPAPLPTAAELIGLIDEATHIEAHSGEWEETTWSKTLTEADIANLRAGIGEATEISAEVPRCTPSVVVTLHQQQQPLATLGAFCDQGELSGPIRFEIGETAGSFTPADIATLGVALRPPVP
jgi:hypothetical protein